MRADYGHFLIANESPVETGPIYQGVSHKSQIKRWVVLYSTLVSRTELTLEYEYVQIAVVVNFT